MNVKNLFLSRDIYETIYTDQKENIVIGDLKFMVCKLTKTIYGLKQSPHLWDQKFHKDIISFNFELNLVDEYIYHGFKMEERYFPCFVCRQHLAFH